MSTPAPSLTNLNIVITRPTKQAIEWQRTLQNLGAFTHLLPVMEIEPVTEAGPLQALKNRILELDNYQKLIFVSQNAVEQAARWIDQYWPQLPVGVECFAIGARTAQCLQQHFGAQGIDIKMARQSMNSEELLQLPELRQVEQQKILIFRGCGGRPKLADTLSDRGATVEFCELYLRAIPHQSEQQFMELWSSFSDTGKYSQERNLSENCVSSARWVLAVHSGESLENFCLIQQRTFSEQGLDPNAITVLGDLPILVPGQRVAEKASKLGFSQDNIVVAENATDAAMTAALEDWNRSHI